MSRLIFFTFGLSLAINAHSQEIFQNGDKFGLRYDGVVFYTAVYDEIKIKAFFVYGRVGNTYTNLSRNKDNFTEAYKKFSFSLIDRLLVIGYKHNGKLDILDETGQHVYLRDGDYSKVLAGHRRITYGNDDILLVRKSGKLGLYDWTSQKEILPPLFDKIGLHESCNGQGYFIYTQLQSENSIRNDKGVELMNFRSPKVDDMLPSDICEGYFVMHQGFKGYCCQMRNGKYFLIKPIYENIEFPNNNSSLIIVERREKFGLYFNYKRMTKCKYEEIELLDDPYVLAKLTKNEVTFLLKRNGEIIKEIN